MCGLTPVFPMVGHRILEGGGRVINCEVLYCYKINKKKLPIILVATWKSILV